MTLYFYLLVIVGCFVIVSVFFLMIFIHYTNVYRFVFPRGGVDVGKLVLNNNEMADLSHRYILILNDYLYILHDVDAYLT